MTDRPLPRAEAVEIAARALDGDLWSASVFPDAVGRSQLAQHRREVIRRAERVVDALNAAQAKAPR